MAKKKIKTNRKGDIYKAIIACVLVLILALIAGLIYKKITLKEAQKISAQEEKPAFYDENLCRCVERERMRCREGFELDSGNRSCRQGNDITNVILACSKYECAGDIYTYNDKKREWEKKLTE